MVGDILQPTHLLFVLVVALLVLGPKRLPEVGRQLGSGLRDFRAAMNGEHVEQPDVIPNSPSPTVASQAPAASPTEHQFAYEATESVGDEHRFAHASSDATQSRHEFAHEETPTVPGHEVGTEPPQPAGEHEFAYEPSRPADEPTDSLS